MAMVDPISELQALSRYFGAEAARRKRELLTSLVALERVAARDLVRLQDAVNFVRAYPDDARVRAAVLRVQARFRAWVERAPGGGESGSLRDHGLPGGVNGYSYSYGGLLRMTRRYPDCLEIDWEHFEDEGRLGAVMELLLTELEAEAAHDQPCDWAAWLEMLRPPTAPSDLAFLLQRAESLPWRALARAHLLDTCDLPLRYTLRHPGMGRCEIELPTARIHYQKQDLPRERFPLEPQIRAPLPPLRPRPAREGEALIDVGLTALYARNLEIHPLLWPNPRDVFAFDAGRGIQVVLSGVLPEHREALTTIYFFLVVKNGVPVAYGPACPLLGCCEMGINLFPEFRGGEIRTIYAQVMRVLHHLFAVDLFYLTRYGMGVGNEDAIRSGAFWFYRKLGFRPTNPAVEALALEEEDRIRTQKGYRSDRRTLRRLSKTEAVLDLSNGQARRYPLGRLGDALNRFLAEAFDGDREAAERVCTARIQRTLDIGSLRAWSTDERRALHRLAPTLAMIPGLSSWSVRDKQALVRIVRAKGAASEAQATRRIAKHARLRAALWDLTDLA